MRACTPRLMARQKGGDATVQFGPCQAVVPGGAKSKMNAIIVGAFIAAVPAVLGYTVSYINNVKASRLVFVDRQLKKLYGPLYALTQANNATWRQFHQNTLAPPPRILFRSGRTAKHRSSKNLANLDPQRVAADEFGDAMRHRAELSAPLRNRYIRPDLASPKANPVAALNYPARIIARVSESFKALNARREFLEPFMAHADGIAEEL
jgi:hypothetical protein